MQPSNNQSNPTDTKRGRKRIEVKKNAFVGLLFYPADLEKLDQSRGSISRSKFIRDATLARIAKP